MKTDQFLSRVAVSSIVAVIGGIALINQPGDAASPIITWWLIYAVCCGIALAVKPADSVRLVALMALLPALVPVLEAATLQFIINQPGPISGARIIVPISGARITPANGTAITLVNWFGIFLFSYARRSMLQVIRRGENEELKIRLKNLEASVRALALLLGTLALLIAGIGVLTS